MDSVGEGEGGKIWENGIETCKISCMKRVASPGLMHDTGCLAKPSRGDGIPVELFQILKDDAVKVLHSICQQIWKT